MNNKFSSIAGVTLVELLIGIVISMIMMAAMFTSYQAVNNSYSQVIDRAKISQTGRNIVGMIVKDIRLAGFRYFNDTSKSPTSYVPILITKATGSGCDKIDIMYSDKRVKPASKPKVYIYTTYKITYECKQSNILDKKTKNKISAFAIYKSKSKWDGTKWESPTNSTDDLVYKDEMIVDYVQDFTLIPIDDKGKIIDPTPTTLANSNKIKVIDILLSVRSQNIFYKNNKSKTIYSLGKKSNKNFNDKFLREQIVVSAHTRNMGL